MRLLHPTFIACAAGVLAGPLDAAPALQKSASEPNAHAVSSAAYQRNLTCAATMAAFATRLPSTSSANAKQDAADGVQRERTLAIETGGQLQVPASDVDHLIAQKRDKRLAEASALGNAAKANRSLFIDVVECEVDQLGDAIAKAKAERAAHGNKP